MVRHGFNVVMCCLADVLHRRQLSEPQKKSYIDAVLCLAKKKAISGIAGAVNRFDDHQAVHNSQTDNIHWVVRYQVLKPPKLPPRITDLGSFHPLAPLFRGNF